nr:PREDICTED: RNA-binding protein 43 isoform X1 [Anolis carolinensis]|eukprot:XP_016851786.1 PREDICTED: RNA-binding protein 43 isoform X1 [Anolis carolinensis]
MLFARPCPPIGGKTHAGETKVNIAGRRRSCEAMASDSSPFYVRVRGATAQAAKPERTIVVYGVPDGFLNTDIMVDILIIHFQKQKNKGGDVEDIIYPTSTQGVAYITFEDKGVAENVLKNEHQLEDKRLHQSYPLKVSLYRESVFTCVSCTLGLATFRAKCSLEDLIEDLKKNIPKLSFGPLHPNGQIKVQGPFCAISELQKMLLLRIKDSCSEQHQNVKKKEPDHMASTSQTKSRLSTSPTKSLESRNASGQDASEDELSVSLDTDIYHYMKKFKNKLYQKSLEQCGVVGNASAGDEITTIYLRKKTPKSSNSQLEHAKDILESLSAELHSSLRKERLPLKGSTKTEKQKRVQAFNRVCKRYPNVLVTEYSDHIDIVGSSSDVFEFTQEMKKMFGNSQKESWK